MADETGEARNGHEILQDPFVVFIRENELPYVYGLVDFEVWPNERMLAVKKGFPQIIRNYYGQFGNETHLRKNAMAMFNPVKEGWGLRAVHKYGETSRELTSIVLFDFGPCLDMVFNGNFKCRFQCDVNGDLATISHDYHALEPEETGWKIEMSELQTGELFQREDDGVDVTARLDKDGVHMHFRTQKGNKVREEKLIIPLKVDKKSMVSSLFSPELLNDPLMSPPEEDHEWLNANLRRVWGVINDRG